MVFGGAGGVGERPDTHGALQLPKHPPRAWSTTTMNFGFCSEVLVQFTHWLMVKFPAGNIDLEQLYSFQVKSAISNTAHAHWRSLRPGVD